MPKPIEPCCVCNQPKPRRESVEYLAACADCEGIYHICFTSVDDAKGAIAEADRETLEKAFGYELKRAGSRKTLRVMIARAIAKRIREQQSTRPTTHDPLP